MQVNKTDIVTAMNKVLPGVDKGKAQIEGADSFLFMGNKLYTYNGVITVSVPFAAEGAEFAVKAVDFFNLVSKMTDEVINIELDERKVRVKSGKTRASLALIDGSAIKKYIQNITLGEMSDVPPDFKEAFSIVAIKANATKLKGILITDSEGHEGSLMVSSDRIRISCQELKGKMTKMFVDDDILANALKLGDPKKYSISGPWLHLSFDGDVTFSAMRKDHSEYPVDAMLGALSRVAKSNPVFKGRLPKDLIDVIQRVGVLAGTAQGGTGELVKLTFTKDGLVVFAEKIYGDAEEVVPWDIAPTIENEEPSIWVDKGFIIEAANKAMEFSLVQVANNKSVVIFKSDRYLNMVTTTTR